MPYRVDNLVPGDATVRRLPPPGYRMIPWPEGGLSSKKISTLAVHNEKLIVGTFDRGIAVLQGGRFETVNQAKGMSDNRVEALETAGDDLWVGTVNGLNRLTGFLRKEGD